MNKLNSLSSQESKFIYFNSLPHDMTTEIYGHLNYQDQKSFLRTSKSSYHKIEGNKPFPKVWELYEGISTEFKKGAFEGRKPKRIMELAMFIILGTISTCGIIGIKSHFENFADKSFVTRALTSPIFTVSYIYGIFNAAIAIMGDEDPITVKKILLVSATGIPMLFFSKNFLATTSAYSYSGGFATFCILKKSHSFLTNNTHIESNITAIKISCFATACRFAVIEAFTWGWNNSCMRIYHNLKHCTLKPRNMT